MISYGNLAEGMQLIFFPFIRKELKNAKYIACFNILKKEPLSCLSVVPNFIPFFMSAPLLHNLESRALTTLIHFRVKRSRCI